MEAARYGFPAGAWRPAMLQIAAGFLLWLTGCSQPIKPDSVPESAISPHGHGDSPHPAAVVLTAYPDTPIALLANVLYLKAHGLERDVLFYSNASLQRLFGAENISGSLGSRDISVLFDLRCAPSLVTLVPGTTLPGASGWVRRMSDDTTHGDVYFVDITFNDPAIRPDYAAFERILGDEWNDWEQQDPVPFIPPAHQMPFIPKGPPRKTFMTFRKTTAQGAITLTVYFDQDSKAQKVRALTSFAVGTH